MTTTSEKLITNVKRCAMCKIDLKGRFVYVDDTTEQLTGFTKEELFGKKIIDFVTESGRDLVSHILYQRNHYETFFESIRLELSGRGKDPISATVLFSLNFIAGNPVNFLVIIDSDTNDNYRATLREKEYRLRDFLHELLVLSPDRYDTESSLILAEYLAPYRAVIYRDTDGVPEVVAAATSTSATGTISETIQEPFDLLRWVSASGNEYCFDNPECVRMGMEKFNQAPNEFITPFTLGSNLRFLARLMFETNISPSTVRQRIADTRQAIRLVERLRPVQSHENEDEQNQSEQHDLSDKYKENNRFLVQEAQNSLNGAHQILEQLKKELS
jgi:PAS domain S-box-containing protein